MTLNGAAERLCEAAERHSRAATNLVGYRKSIECGTGEYALEREARREYVAADLELREKARAFLESETAQDDPTWLDSAPQYGT